MVTDPAKALGQDMLRDKPREVVAFEGALERFAGTALDVFEGDMTILAGDDDLFTDVTSTLWSCTSRMQPDTKSRGHTGSALLLAPWPRGFVPLMPGVMSRRAPSVVVSNLSKMQGVFLNFTHDTVFIGYATGPISG
ncbi:MAG: hypothetical protein MUC41_06610 [Syntrophobacteraceae bacterium]|nr:hypothetical protein [Syntrophobacteraceae bacterium]